MRDVESLRRLQALIADCVVAGDVERLRREAAGLPEALRLAIDHVDDDGFRIAELLVAKLRFERLLHGSVTAGAWFAADPQSFTTAFRRYHQTVTPVAHDPAGEAASFDAWRAAQEA